MIAAGEDNTLLNTTSFLVFHIVHIAPAHMKSVTCCFFLGHPSTMSVKKAEQLVGEEGHPRQLRMKDHKKMDRGH
jgi:hypothetical protein